MHVCMCVLVKSVGFLANRDDYIAFAFAVRATLGGIHFAFEDSIDFRLEALISLGAVVRFFVVLTSGQGPVGEIEDLAIGEAVTKPAEAAKTRVNHFMVIVVIVSVIVVVGNA